MHLGAIVTATDVRATTKEQVESLGGSFIMVESEESGDAAGGYAKEMSEDYKRAQAALVAEHIKKQDIVITTALIPGRPAPELVSNGELLQQHQEDGDEQLLDVLEQETEAMEWWASAQGVSSSLWGSSSSLLEE